jgi:hypothetical protein
MEGTAVLQRSLIIDDALSGRSVLDFFPKTEKTKKANPVEERLAAEDNGNFVDYLECLEMLNDQKIVVLPVRHHYFYDMEDFRDITVIVNLKRLNLIKDLDLFLENIFNIMQPETELIGCFNDKKANTRISLRSRVYRKMINFLDSRIDMDLDKKDLTRKFLAKGFSVIDMTEINGLTYFRIRNIKKPLLVSA